MRKVEEIIEILMNKKVIDKHNENNI